MPSMPPTPSLTGPTRRRVLAAVPGVLLAGAVGGSTETMLHGYPRRHLHNQTVAVAGPARRLRISDLDQLVSPEGRVAAGIRGEDGYVEAEDRFLDGADGLDDVPRPWRETARTGLLDLRVHTLGSGAVLAGWSQPWRYVWPRDSAFVLAAYARYGRHAEARRVLGFLQRTLPAQGPFQARYLPDGSGVPDDRGVQLDGSGWVLWGMQQWAGTLSRTTRRDAVRSFGALLGTCTQTCLTATAGGTALPAPSPDYWEVRETATTLGTAAPVLAGLLAAARLLGTAGDRAGAREAREAHHRLAVVVRQAFGPGYPRYAGDTAVDTAVTFMLPPFTEEPDDEVVAAWRHARDVMRRPGGGHAPGERWIPDGISWTPETALFGLSAAAAGLADEARQELDWLSTHRTAAGSLPEKVLPDGSPAAVAPLSWTAATFLLAARP